MSSEHEPATNPPRLAAIHRDPPHLTAIHQPRWQEEGTKKKRIEVRTRVRKARSNHELEEARSSEMAAGPDLSGAGASGKKKGKGRRKAPRVGLGFSSLSSPAVPSSCPRRALALRRSAVRRNQRTPTCLPNGITRLALHRDGRGQLAWLVDWVCSIPFHFHGLLSRILMTCFTGTDGATAMPGEVSGRIKLRIVRFDFEDNSSSLNLVPSNIDLF